MTLDCNNIIHIIILCISFLTYFSTRLMCIFASCVKYVMWYHIIRFAIFYFHFLLLFFFFFFHSSFYLARSSPENSKSTRVRMFVVVIIGARVFKTIITENSRSALLLQFAKIFVSTQWRTRWQAAICSRQSCKLIVLKDCSNVITCK